MSTTYRWIVINESAYELFCREDLSFQEEFDIVLSCTTIKHIRNNLRLRTIFDLFYQAFALAKAHKFNYFSAHFLVEMVDIELTRIMDFGRESYCSDSAKLFDYNEEYDKLCSRMDEQNTRNNIPVESMKALTTFYIESFLKVSAAYIFVLNEVPKEVAEIRRLRVHTPTIPKPLSLFKKT